ILIPRSIPLLYAILLLLFLSFGRFTVRWKKDYGILSRKQAKKRVLVIGCNNEAESLIREMLRDKQHLYQPVAIVDANPANLNREIHRIRVVGHFQEISQICENYRVDMIFIALSNASAREMQFILQVCFDLKIPHRIAPSFKETLSNQPLLSEMREVNVEDLLGRETYQVDLNLFHSMIEGKCILVTGGGGSIGSELCRHIAALNPACLLIIDHSEANLYRIHFELRNRFPYLQVQISLVSILQLETLEALFKKYQPKIVFHAAAYKHVPMLETQVLTAVRNNVIGSKNVVDLSIQYQVETFVQVSTDKAVNPTSIMGMTKRVAEIYCQQLSAQVNTKIMTVRFGNVLGSVGSVIPLFKTQLQEGGPLTVTHPEIKRYFMTIPESCRLILQAMTMGQGGEIFVLDMGEPIKIKDLAEQMIHLSGKKINEDIKIVYTGLRAGEKLWEDLFYDTERLAKTAHKKIRRAEAAQFDVQFIQQYIAELQRACEQQDEKAALAALKKLVPEYKNTTHQSVPTDLLSSSINPLPTPCLR
ncbi:MAG: hypothetical protein A3H51_01565, partial [Candidatus Spechtbacteria bacterium RIFCSPLOWO2_02_FULL_38_8]